jgi:hypothetical protein
MPVGRHGEGATLHRHRFAAANAKRAGLDDRELNVAAGLT